MEPVADMISRALATREYPTDPYEAAMELSEWDCYVLAGYELYYESGTDADGRTDKKRPKRFVPIKPMRISSFVDELNKSVAKLRRLGCVYNNSRITTPFGYEVRAVLWG